MAPFIATYTMTIFQGATLRLYKTEIRLLECDSLSFKLSDGGYYLVFLSGCVKLQLFAFCCISYYTNDILVEKLKFVQ